MQIMLFVKVLVTAVAAFGGGLLLLRLKVPGGMIIGAVIVTAAVSLITGYTYMPLAGKLAAQICAGAFIASTVKREDLRRVGRNCKAPLLLLSGLLFLNLSMGTVLYAITDLDKLTCYMSVVPGGLTDIPMITEEMGGSSAIVLVAQFVRVVVGLALFPLVTAKTAQTQPSDSPELPLRDATDNAKRRAIRLLGTCIIATLGGLAGRRIGLPAGALIGSLLTVLVWHLLSGKAFMPRTLRRATQCLAGAYIGCSLSMDSLRTLGDSAFGLLFVSSAYVFGCLCIAWMLWRFTALSKRASLLASMPASASDVALIAADMSVSVPDVVALQLVRLVVVIALFPQLIALLLKTGFPFF